MKNHYHHSALKPIDSPSQNSFIHNQKLSHHPSSSKMKGKFFFFFLVINCYFSLIGVLSPLSSTSPLLISPKNISYASTATLKFSGTYITPQSSSWQLPQLTTCFILHHSILLNWLTSMVTINTFNGMKYASSSTIETFQQLHNFMIIKEGQLNYHWHAPPKAMSSPSLTHSLLFLTI